MKGVDVLIASVLILIISITAMFFALQLGGPSTQRTKEILLMQEGKNTLVSIDNSVKNVLTEGEGSTRVLRFSISGGYYKVDNSTNSLIFSMESAGQIIAEGASKIEDEINFTGKAGMIYLNLSYDNIQIVGKDEFGRGYHTLTIRNNGYNTTTQKQMIYISLTPPIPPTLVTFTSQYNQTQTLVLTGTNTTSPINLNKIDGLSYNVIEMMIRKTEDDASSDLEVNEIQNKITPTFVTFFYEPANSIDTTTWDNTVDSDWTASVTNACNGTSFRDILTGLSHLKSKNAKLNTTGYTDIKVNFTASVNALDTGEYLRFYWYNGTSWNQTWSRQANLACIIQSFSLTDSANNNPNFAMNFSCNHNAGANERCIVDDVRVSGNVIEKEKNTTYTSYNNIPINTLEIIQNITVIVNVSSFNNTGSLINSNSNPDLWLEIYNGTQWIEIGNMNVNGIGNFSKSTQDLTILNAWTSQINRNIRIKGRYLDFYSSSSFDSINYTDVWIIINSTSTNHRTEIEHNATGISWFGTLNNINVSLNFSTNSTNSPKFDFLIYNFNSDSWEICDTLNPMVNIWNMRWCNITTNPSYYSFGGIISTRLNETSHQSFAEVKEDYIQYYVTYTQ